jgi:hypothetical protein
MATIEREHEQERIQHELPVFVASDGRRARRLRLAASAIAVLALLWLAALAVGMLGFGRLPGLATPLGRIGGADKAQSERSESRSPTSARSEPRSADLIVAPERSGRPSASQRSARGRAAVKRANANAAARRPRTTPPAPGVQPVQPQPAPPPPQQGWARHGRPAPPGYTRRTQPQPAPPPTGQASAPGQAKKAVTATPPAPPPPPGNGGGSKKS